MRGGLRGLLLVLAVVVLRLGDCDDMGYEVEWGGLNGGSLAVAVG
jgi:hypothetical protein